MHDESFEPEDLVRSLSWSSAIAREHELLAAQGIAPDPGHQFCPPVLPFVDLRCDVRSVFGFHRSQPRA